MQVRIIRDSDGLRALQGPWEEMLQNSSFKAPYYSWNWQEAWWKHYGAGNELFVIAGEKGGKLQVLAPFIKSRASVRGLKVREIRFLAHSITPHNQILFRRECSPAEALATVFECLAAHWQQWDIVNLWNVPAAAAYLPSLEQATAHSGLHAMKQPGICSAYIPLDKTLEDYLHDDVRKGHRRGILQKVRQLTRQPGYQVTVYGQPEEIHRGLELAFRVSKASWKGKLGADMTGLEARRRFYTEVTPRLAQCGQVRIWIASLGQTPIALQYHLVAAEKAYFIVNDFDAGYEKSSPGTVLLYQVLERLFQEKRYREFYFGGDLYDYKRQWAGGTDPHVNLEIFHHRSYSRLLWWTKSSVMPLLRTAKVKMFQGLCVGNATKRREPSC